MARRTRDDEFQALFGHCEDADEIEQIKNNDSDLTEFSPIDVEGLTGEAWEKLGGYIAGNDYLRKLDLSGCNLDSAKIRGLTATSGALRSIILFKCRRNGGVDSRCFDLLIEALDGGAIEDLNVGSSSISNPIALARCTLPKLSNLFLDGNGITHISCKMLDLFAQLKVLNLSRNNIEEGGFRALANLLQMEDCGLVCLSVKSTGMGVTGAKILADSLRCNDKLETLAVDGNEIGREGLGAFLRILNDVSSIRSTERSNNTLTNLGMEIFHTQTDDAGEDPHAEAIEGFRQLALRAGGNPNAAILASYRRVLEHRARRVNLAREEPIVDGTTARGQARAIARIKHALETNREHRGNPHAAGKAKVLDTQLCRKTREELSRLQGIGCPGYHQLFSDLDPVLLPNVLALVGARNKSQNELYPAIIAKASDLVSLIDKKAMLLRVKAKNEARIAAVTAELARLNVVNSRIECRLISIEADERACNCGRKRGSNDISP